MRHAIRAMLAALLLPALAACALPGQRPAAVPEPPAEPVLHARLPAGHTGYDNASLARLFVLLTHDTEWGGRRPHLVRIEAPVVVGIEGPGAALHQPFLDTYLAYLRQHGGLDIRRGAVDRNMVVRLVPGGDFRDLLPAASCVLVAGDRRWRDFERDPAGNGGDALAAAPRLEAVTIFIPADAIPADVRRCLLEEIAQGLGPLNDLYGLGPSVFNDDFGHVWPTRLDLLMLRVLYAPEMATGLSRSETEARARLVLERINPAGRRARPLPPVRHRAEPAWRRLIAGAFRGDRSASERRRAATEALRYAEVALPGTAWHCHSLVTLAHLEKLKMPEQAAARLVTAERVCTRVHGAEDPRIAQARLTRAGLALNMAMPEKALELTEGLAPVLAGHGLDEALAAHYSLRARALEGLGRSAEARAEARRAAAWEAYATGRSRSGAGS
ncbi:DUF2927 domain-containing protein [Paralimibaculum aggregatum]|uniref:DUF2927 domain-containing protein n=1 Tax=Paralimibaculum aggregatum TaxID=3036245 RepID=A0ABQ6LM34_9RHOB|nr:DUF2927 domain-containing protein [Limibaculum sp. NKW23]GMG83364.1 DUF2927 domain-containing protein [Limibaculum sp. NKW23]